MKRDKVWLSDAQVDKMLRLARAKSKRDYAMLLLMRYGLRVGEICGHQDSTVYYAWVDRHDHSKGREKRICNVDLPGLYFQDIMARDRELWVRGKGKKTLQVPMPQTVFHALRTYVEEARLGAGAKLFDLSETTAEKLVRDYAREAGVERCDEKGFGPHRLRAFYATDAKNRGLSTFEVRDLMRHSKLATTERYVGRSTTQQLHALQEKIAGGSQAGEEA